MMLVLCLVIFVVLTNGEALAAEGPSQTTQQGTVQTMTTINGKVAEPVAEKTPSVETPPVETSPVQTLPGQTPPPDKTPPAEEEPSPPPVARAPSTPEPEPVPASQLTPQWFAVVITEGEPVESEPVLTTTSWSTTWSTTDPDQASDVAYPAPDSATPLGASGSSSYVPSTSTDAGVAPGYAVEEDAVPTDQWASEPVLGSVGSDQVAPESATQYPESVISPGTDPQLVPAASLLGKRGEAPIAVTRPSTVKPAPAFPASVGGAPLLPSSLGTTAVSAVGTTVKNAAASVASATAEVLGSLTGVSPSNSSTNGTQEQSSEGTPQQPASAPPLAPPAGGGQFSLSTGGGGNVGPGGGFVPVLLGMLALAAIVLKRDFGTYLVSCEMPKPSSALLTPLERPG